jgi:WD40 repeat protein
MSGSYKFEKIASLDKSILTANPDLELHRNQVKIPLSTPDAKLLKCFDWIKSNDQEMIALGYSFGRVLLGRLIEEKLKLVAEFVPKHSRSCIDVAFCPINSNLLATALDKVRNDCGLNVWDIEQCTVGSDFVVSQFKGSTGSLYSNNNEKPIASYGSSEGISSMAWFHSSAKIIAGMSQKWIRLFDLRGKSILLSHRYYVIFSYFFYQSCSWNYY